MTRGRRLLLVPAATLLACGAREAPPRLHGPSTATAVATVAEVGIPGPLVAAVSGAEGKTPSEALGALVEDALAARGGLDRGLDREAAVSWATRVALARRTLQQLSAEAQALGLPTDEELDAVTVVHAVVLRSSVLPEDDAIAAATAVAQAVEGSRTVEAFEARARAIERPHVRIVAEEVGPFTIDGRTADGHDLEKAFVGAAFSLRSAHELSPVVATSFGWHVLELVSRVPLPGEQADRRNALAKVAVENRTRVRLADILRVRRQRTRIEISSDAESLMAAGTSAQ